MRRLIVAARISQIVFYMTSVGFLAVAAYVIWPLRPAVQESQKTVHDAGEVVRGVQQQIGPTSHSLGIILGRAAITSDEIAKASIAQKTYWDTISEKTADLIDDTQITVKSWGQLGATAQAQIEPTFTRFNLTLDRTNSLLATTDAQVQTVGPLLTSATSLIQHTDGLVSDPNLRGSLVNLNRFSASAALAADDGQRKLHSWLYPARSSRLQRVLGLLPMAEKLAEFGYYAGPLR